MLLDQEENIKLLKNAYYKNDVDTVKQIIKTNTNLLYSNLFGEDSILHQCGYSGKEPMLKMLLEEFNPDVNRSNWYWQTPASYAAKNNHFGCILLLLKHGANFKEDRHFLDNLDDLLAINYFCKNIPAVKQLVSFSQAASKIDYGEVDYNNIDYDIPSYEELDLSINDDGKLQLEVKIDCVFDNFNQLLEFVSVICENESTVKKIDGSVAMTGKATYIF